MTQPDALRPLAGRHIAVPESRQLDVLDRLLARRGAEVLRCPLLEIVDAPDAAPVLAWLRDFLHSPPDYLILMTGEGLARLRGFADSGGIATDALKQALERTTLISRGPKPARELRRLGLAPKLFAPQPTTDGVIELLKDLDIDGRSIALQLYGDDPNVALVSYLQRRSAKITTVAPYRYAPRLSHEHIAELLAKLEQGSLDAIVFTSKAQVERLFKVSAELNAIDALESGLARTLVAAIGPVVADILAANGCQADIMPDERYFMKPLVQSLIDKLVA
jgi:uroporphyrinogen-III synthase